MPWSITAAAIICMIAGGGQPTVLEPISRIMIRTVINMQRRGVMGVLICRLLMPPGCMLIRIMERRSSRIEGVEAKKRPAYTGGWDGNVLVSRGAAPKVSSELEGLTFVFGMGTGVPLPL